MDFFSVNGGKIVQQLSSALVTISSSLTMKVRYVIEALLWLTSQDVTLAWMVSDSMSMLHEVQMGIIAMDIQVKEDHTHLYALIY